MPSKIIINYIEAVVEQNKSLQQELKRKEEECEEFRKANDEKNEFLQSLGISAGGEFKRIKYYIDKLQEQNKSLQQQLKQEQQSSQEARDTAIKEFNRAEELTALLKRKEEELKMEISVREAKQDIINTLNDKYYNIEEQLQAEQQKVKELEEKIESLTILLMDLDIAHKTVLKGFWHTDKSRDYWREQAEKYKQALEEIKEMLDTAIKATNAYNHFDAVEKAFKKVCEVLDA